MAYYGQVVGYSPLGGFAAGFLPAFETMASLAMKAKDYELRAAKEKREAELHQVTMEKEAELREAAKQSKIDAQQKREAEQAGQDFTEGGGAPSRIGTAGGGRGGGGTAAWGEGANEAYDELKKLKLSDAAIMGIMVQPLHEGGFKTNWLQSGAYKNGVREQSYGPWQFNAGGELPGYLANEGANDDKSYRAQARYIARRMEELHPGYSQIDDAGKAADIVLHKFERPLGHENMSRAGSVETVYNLLGKTSTAKFDATIPQISTGRAERLGDDPNAPLTPPPGAPVIGAPANAVTAAPAPAPTTAAPAATTVAPPPAPTEPAAQDTFLRNMLTHNKQNQLGAFAQARGQMSDAYAAARNAGFTGTYEDYVQGQYPALAGPSTANVMGRNIFAGTTSPNARPVLASAAPPQDTLVREPPMSMVGDQVIPARSRNPDQAYGPSAVSPWDYGVSTMPPEAAGIYRSRAPRAAQRQGDEVMMMYRPAIGSLAMPYAPRYGAGRERNALQREYSRARRGQDYLYDPRWLTVNRDD
jgi:Phage tail lysozyme